MTSDPRQQLDDTITNFENVTKDATVISERNIGLFHTGRQNKALFLLTKLIAHNSSLLLIADYWRRRDRLDHFSIAALVRIVMDASLMTMYLSRPTLSRNQ